MVVAESVYPNQAEELLYVQLDRTNKIDRCEVLSPSLQLLQTQQETGFYSMASINVTNLITGIYILKIYCDNETMVKFFVKK